MACGQIGLTIDYFYSLTSRQFSNIVAGYQKKEDNLSKERWIITRKLMYASMWVNLKEGIKETDILPFEFEKEVMQSISEEEEKQMLIDIENNISFWEKFDQKNLN